jgi:hypothetical protein
LINHFSSIIISDISLKYSLRNHTSSSGENFSDILVNHSISEKKIAIFLFSQSKFTFQSQDNISFATSTDTYSESALFNLALFLFSIKYLTVFEIANDKTNQTNSSTGKFNTKYVFNITINGKISKKITIIDTLLANNINHERLKLK